MANLPVITKKTNLLKHISAFGLSTAALLSPTAQSVSFNIGEVEGNATSQLSVGASWRVEDPSSNLISVGNGGSAPSNTTDDGTSNFEKGETFSKIFKGIHDLELTYQNYGAFFRGKYWYDFELEDENRIHGNIANDYAAGEPLNDDGFSSFARFSGAEILDAFIYGDFEVNEMPLDLRLGSQVVSWGESTFIQGGINSINPFDVSAFRRPGAEIKEGLLPVPMIYGALAINDNLSVESFYQLQWKKTEIDGCGTFFSTADWAAEGCDGLAFASIIPDATNVLANTIVERSADDEPENQGQYGVALRYYSEALDTEFGAYYINYHSRLPYVSVIRSTLGTHPAAIPNPNGFDGQYRVVYPEDINLIGLSFATNIGSWALSGEVSHRPDLPAQINGADLLLAGLTDGLAPNPFSSEIEATALGEEAAGFRKFAVTQAQATAIGFFDQVLGASRITLIGELGATFVHDLDDQLRFGRNTAFGVGQSDEDGYLTDTAWGYRLRGTLEYPNALAGVNLKPIISFSHDVDGYSPSPAQQFQESRKQLGLAINFDYLSKYAGSLSYTRYFGGEYNEITDRDFIALSMSFSF